MHPITQTSRLAIKLAVVASLIVMFAGCSNTQTPVNTPATTTQEGHSRGVGFTPKSFNSGDFNQFFSLAGQAGGIVIWAGDWQELESGSGAPSVLAQTAPKYGCVSAFALQFFEPSTCALLSPLDEPTMQRYKTAAVAFVTKYRPEYLGIGVEVNILFEKSPADFEVFARFYDEVYLALKAASSGTKVFPIFQLEKMKGLSGGLFGGVNDTAKNEWALMDRFPHSDLAAFTTYPGLIYKNPSEIPADYYTEIAKHTVKPIAFTEIGWHSASGPQGWESSEDEQAGFVRSFFSLTQGLNPLLELWSFLYDQNTAVPFNSMGLIRQNGNPKSAFNEWSQGRRIKSKASTSETILANQTKTRGFSPRFFLIVVWPECNF